MSNVQALQNSFQGDLTSFQGMLNYERSLRTAMGKLKHKWPAGLKVPHAMMLAHNFIPEEEAPKAPGWDPVNPNGFGPAEPYATNPMGEPGYTYTTNREDLGVEQKGPGYYQVLVYLRHPAEPQILLPSGRRMLRLDLEKNSSPFRQPEDQKHSPEDELMGSASALPRKRWAHAGGESPRRSGHWGARRGDSEQGCRDRAPVCAGWRASWRCWTLTRV